MEYNNPSQIVKDLTFGIDASDKLLAGISKLSKAVGSTLGASGKCVIYEDALGKPVITKDGVTVAESVILQDPVENIGATLIKEAAKKTVQEAGDGTTTATVLASGLLYEMYDAIVSERCNIRDLKEGIEAGKQKVLDYLDKSKTDILDEMLEQVATISTNNDTSLGKIIADAYKAVGKNGVVLMEESDDESTYYETVDGIQFDCGLKSSHLATDDNKEKSELDNPYILIVASPVPNIRKIQNVLEHAIKQKRSLLIVAAVDQQPMSALMMNKVKGNIKVNVIDLPGFGSTKRDTIEDLAALTGATIIDEELGDDLDMVSIEALGEATKSITTQNNTIITIPSVPSEATERIDIVRHKIAEEQNGFIKTKLEQRLAMLSGAVAIIKVGANSQVELKEKKDRVEDAIHATKAALKEGVVPGGGVALLNATEVLNYNNPGELTLGNAIVTPYETILQNAEFKEYKSLFGKPGYGYDVKTGSIVDMIKSGIIDPVLVTKTALINAVSVATTIISANCIISNKRIE